MLQNGTIKCKGRVGWSAVRLRQFPAAANVIYKTGAWSLQGRFGEESFVSRAALKKGSRSPMVEHPRIANSTTRWPWTGGQTLFEPRTTQHAHQLNLIPVAGQIRAHANKYKFDSARAARIIYRLNFIGTISPFLHPQRIVTLLHCQCEVRRGPQNGIYHL